MTYLLVNIGSIIIPLIASFHPRLNFHKKWFAAWPAILLTATPFILWDIYYTHLGVWGFNPLHLTGVDLVNLPIEEWLFFICIPYACLFTYEVFKVIIKKDYFQKYATWMSLTLIVILLVFSVLNFEKLYTSVTFYLAAIYLTLHTFKWKSRFMGRFWFAYIVLLIPFLITNGILTGSFITQEVVWYNPLQFMGYRIFTIPVEDSIYGLLMILMNIHWYEYLLTRRARARELKFS